MDWKQCLFENTNGKVQQRRHPTGNKILETSLGDHMNFITSRNQVSLDLQLLLILSNRSWDKVCVVLRETKIEFYKDSKAYRSSPRDTYRGEDPIDIVGATSEIASDYKKKPHVFRLK